jgi:hypothetical protein
MVVHVGGAGPLPPPPPPPPLLLLLLLLLLLVLLVQDTTRSTPHPLVLSVRRTVTSVVESYVKAKRSPQA